MSTLAWVLLGVATWIAVLVVVMSLLVMAKRGDEAMNAYRMPPWGPSRGGPVPRVEASSPWLGQRVRDLQGLIRARTIAIALADPQDPDADWVVAATTGAGGLVGRRVATTTAALLEPDDAISAPIAHEGAVLGEIAAAGRDLSARDREFIDRFAGMLAARLSAAPPDEVARARRPAA